MHSIVKSIKKIHDPLKILPNFVKMFFEVTFKLFFFGFNFDLFDFMQKINRQHFEPCFKKMLKHSTHTKIANQLLQKHPDKVLFVDKTR